MISKLAATVVTHHCCTDRIIFISVSIYVEVKQAVDLCSGLPRHCVNTSSCHYYLRVICFPRFRPRQGMDLFMQQNTYHLF